MLTCLSSYLPLKRRVFLKLFFPFYQIKENLIKLRSGVGMKFGETPG